MLINRIFFTPDEECTDDASDEGVNVSSSACHSGQSALDQLVYKDEQSKVAAMLPRQLDCLLQFGDGVALPKQHLHHDRVRDADPPTIVQALPRPPKRRYQAAVMRANTSTSTTTATQLIACL